MKADAARRAQRLKLQTSYGQAVMWSKGFAAEETNAAFARAGELATEIGNAETLGRNLLYVVGAQFVSRRVWVGPGGGRRAPFAKRNARRGRRRWLPRIAFWDWFSSFQGDFVQARAHCEQTLRIYHPERDGEAKFHLGSGTPNSRRASYLALAAWCLGGVAAGTGANRRGARARRRIG